MKQELAKSYQPKDFEDRIYQMWNDRLVPGDILDRTAVPAPS